jgi:hypothetical protein
VSNYWTKDDHQESHVSESRRLLKQMKEAQVNSKQKILSLIINIGDKLTVAL